jgi:hypothetical protein
MGSIDASDAGVNPEVLGTEPEVSDD